MTWKQQMGLRLPWLKSTFRRFVKSRKQTFSIAIYRGDTPWQLSSSATEPGTVLTRHDVDDVPAAFVADPFMQYRNGTWNMWFEVMRADRGMGEIGVASSPDGSTWTYGGIVLAEPFHLSYPYVFSWGGETFMIPETGQAGAVRLYRATAYPRAWSLEAELLGGAMFHDASVFRHGDHWWMFVAVEPAAATRPQHATLRLYGASDVRGPWIEHPASPIVHGDPVRARPAGRVVTVDGLPVRFAQDCATAYGRAVRAFMVEELTPSRYRERPLSQSPFLEGGRAAWNRGGMHHLDAHAVGGAWMACVDGWSWERPPTGALVRGQRLPHASTTKARPAHAGGVIPIQPSATGEVTPE